MFASYLSEVGVPHYETVYFLSYLESNFRNNGCRAISACEIIQALQDTIRLVNWENTQVNVTLKS